MKIAVIIIALLLIFSCKTVDKKIISENKLNILPMNTFVIKKDSKGNLTGELTSQLIKSGKFTGKVKINKDGNYEFSIDIFSFLTSWTNGWTTGEFEASGTIVLLKNNDKFTLNVIDNPEIWELTRGEIRYFDDYYLNESGFYKTKERLDRINAYIRYLKEQVKAPYFESIYFKKNNKESFNKIISNLFLTRKSLVPENLKELKSTGTIQKDYDEAKDIFIMFYNLDYFLNSKLKNNSGLWKIKNR